MSKVLIASMGNVLLRDDGFGFEVARQLAARPDLPPTTTVLDVGIGGIHLVQELLDGYDAVVIVDAAEQGTAPGTIRLLEVEVPDLSTWAEDERRDFLADMHYTTPTKALILSKALGVLPPKVYLLGCQPADVSDLGIGLTEPVRRAVLLAVHEIQRLLSTQQASRE
ncbi:MAG: hydrogenase maturation protease [Chloroflexota bacterium]